MSIRHFLDIDQLDVATLRGLLDLGHSLKRGEWPGEIARGKAMALIFEKASTRTRFSFEIGIRQLGGSAIVATAGEMQLGRGESLPDTARVLSRFVDGIMIRTFEQEKLREIATYANVPVINGLTNESHPCQIMADLMTYEEHRGPVEGAVVAWVGDANNVCRSWVHAAVKFGFELRIGAPDAYQLDRDDMEWVREHGGNVVLTADPVETVHGADCVVTDCWVSMGDKDAVERHRRLAPYQVNTALMALAQDGAIFQHCLPAHRGEEVTDEVIDGPQSVVFDETENRLHAQKAIMAWSFGADLPARA